MNSIAEAMRFSLTERKSQWKWGICVLGNWELWTQRDISPSPLMQHHRDPLPTLIPCWVFPILRTCFFFLWRREELTRISPSPYLVTKHGIFGELRWAPGWVLREDEKVLGFFLPKHSSPTHNFPLGSLVREPLWLSIIWYAMVCNESAANTLTRAGRYT